MQSPQDPGKLAFTVTWEVKEGKIDAARDIIARFGPEARKEPGVEYLAIAQSTDNPGHFLFFEIFKDAAAFEAHQQTPHFRTLIMEQALPLLNARQRVRYVAL